MGNVGGDRSLGRADRVARREDVVYADHLHQPALFGGGIVARAGERAGVADGAGELGLPAADDAGDDWLFRLQAVLVVATRLDVHHGGLAAIVVAEGEDELRRGEMDINVLAARDQRGRAPAGGGEVLGDRGGEVARVRKDGDRTGL